MNGLVITLVVLSFFIPIFISLFRMVVVEEKDRQKRKDIAKVAEAVGRMQIQSRYTSRVLEEVKKIADNKELSETQKKYQIQKAIKKLNKEFGIEDKEQGKTTGLK